MPTCGIGAEIALKADNAAQTGLADAQRLGNRAMRRLGDMAKGVLHRMQDRHKRSFEMQIFSKKGVDFLGGGAGHGWPLAVAEASQSGFIMSYQYRYFVD
jgi:hypothetical protein